MRLLRLLMILSILFSVLHTGAMAGAHLLVEHEASSGTAHMMPDADEHCCADTNNPMPDCHVLAALLPVSLIGVPTTKYSSGVSVPPGVLLTGIEPAGPLDPPRSV